MKRLMVIGIGAILLLSGCAAQASTTDVKVITTPAGAEVECVVVGYNTSVSIDCDWEGAVR